ncbi:MAG: polysaccharide deacetylase family protein [Candidatus Woykebacteria bacterium]
MNKFKNRVIVTTSWDDGHVLDLKLAKLLKKYNIFGTFYISPKNIEHEKKDLLSNRDILNISKDFEIGAHTLTHPHLTKISLKEAEEEIIESKEYLEKIISKKVHSFCYPYGDFDSNVKKLVESAGFKIARTTKRYEFKTSLDLFSLPTTFHTYNHFSDIHHILNFSRSRPDRLFKYIDWEYLAMDLFDYALVNKTTFHLWGHSWEIEKYNAWDKLEKVLQYISKRDDVTYVTNSELIL